MDDNCSQTPTRNLSNNNGTAITTVGLSALMSGKVPGKSRGPFWKAVKGDPNPTDDPDAKRQN